MYLLILLLSLTSCIPAMRAAHQKTELIETLNSAVGLTKEQHMRRLGLPTQCQTLSTNEELCEWRSGGLSGGGAFVSGYGGGGSVASWEHRILFSYGTDLKSYLWAYRGSLGTFSSVEYPPTEYRHLW